MSWENITVWVLTEEALCPRAVAVGALRQWWSVSAFCVFQKAEPKERKEASANKGGEEAKPISLVFIIMLPDLGLSRSNTQALGPWIKIFYYLSICVWTFRDCHFWMSFCLSSFVFNCKIRQNQLLIWVGSQFSWNTKSSLWHSNYEKVCFQGQALVNVSYCRGRIFKRAQTTPQLSLHSPLT